VSRVRAALNFETVFLLRVHNAPDECFVEEAAFFNPIQLRLGFLVGSLVSGAAAGEFAAGRSGDGGR
jgi:hypothetical protein